MEAKIEIVDFEAIVQDINKIIPDNVIRITKIKNGYGIYTHSREYAKKIEVFLRPSYKVGEEAYFLMEGENVCLDLMEKWLKNIFIEFS
jgi:hypothetical protein